MKKTIALIVILFAAVFIAGFVHPMDYGPDVLVLDGIPILSATPTPEPKPTNAPPNFGAPIEWPDDLDELYTFIETGKDGYTFEPCQSLRAPFISWDMVVAIKDAAGDDGGAGELWMDGQTLRNILLRGGIQYPGIDLRVSEKRLFGALISAVFAGEVSACGQPDGKPILYGPGVQYLIDHLMPVVGGWG